MFRWGWWRRRTAWRRTQQHLVAIIVRFLFQQLFVFSALILSRMPRLCIRFFIFCFIVCLLSETVQHESQVGKARRRKVWNIDILLTMLSLDMRLKKTHFSQAHWGLSSLQDKSLGSRESHPRDTLTAGEDLQTKVSTNVDLLSILWQNISWQSRTEEQLPVYQPPKKEEVVYSWEDFYPNKSVEVNFVLR